MRTLIDLPKDQIEALDRIARAEKKSRAAIVREAVADLVSDRDRVARRAAIEAGFGLWKGRGVDGLEYQERIRAEWDRDPAA